MPGEASPGTLESGEAMVGAAGLPLPTANPFHSERIRTEMELIRTRPATLDANARRLQTDPDGPNLGEPGAAVDMEPNYVSVLGREESGQEAPRVAQVELAPEEGQGYQPPTWPGVERLRWKLTLMWE
eukprot:s7005_g5.t1